MNVNKVLARWRVMAVKSLKIPVSVNYHMSE